MMSLSSSVSVSPVGWVMIALVFLRLRGLRASVSFLLKWVRSAVPIVVASDEVLGRESFGDFPRATPLIDFRSFPALAM